MAGNSNQLIVQVIGDTKGLQRDLLGAEQQLNRFAKRTSTIRATGADKMLADVRGMQKQAVLLEKQLAQLDSTAATSGSSLRRVGTGSLIAGVAIHTLGRNLSETGGEAGRFGNALSALSSGNFVGFYKAATDSTKAVAAMTAKLVEQGDSAKTNAQANLFAAAGFDKVAAAARAAAKQIEAAALAARPLIQFSAISGGAFGITPLDRLLKPDAKPKKVGEGITASERNQFFDNDITRALDRAQDGSLQSQVTKLASVSALLTKRLAATKDITRKLNLEDQIVSVGRQRQSVLDQISAALKERLADAKAAKIEAQAAELARVQSRQFRAIGLAADGSDIVPGVENLKKQLASLGTHELSGKLRSQLERVGEVLSGSLGKVTRETRAGVDGLFDAIRDGFKKGAKGPLTKEHGLDTSKIVANLGLAPDQIREIRGRLSGFNTAGIALAGGRGARGGFVGGRAPVVESHVTVQVDGHTLGKVTTRSQQKTRKRNPAQRRGPNRGAF